VRAGRTELEQLFVAEVLGEDGVGGQVAQEARVGGEELLEGFAPEVRGGGEACEARTTGTDELDLEGSVSRGVGVEGLVEVKVVGELPEEVRLRGRVSREELTV
jgi:hypothetical protein